jgi:hypothetical protein
MASTGVAVVAELITFGGMNGCRWAMAASAAVSGSLLDEVAHGSIERSANAHQSIIDRCRSYDDNWDCSASRCSCEVGCASRDADRRRARDTASLSWATLVAVLMGIMVEDDLPTTVAVAA